MRKPILLASTLLALTIAGPATAATAVSITTAGFQPAQATSVPVTR